MNSEKSTRFLSEFNKLENFLRTKLDSPNHETFSRMVDKAVDKNISSISWYSHDLKSYSDLRNHIVHRDTRKTRFIAEPTDETLDGIEKLVEKVTKPVSVQSVMSMPVFCCKRDDLLSAVVNVMGEKIFSAVPVIGNDGEIIDVLTTQTIVNIFSKEKFSAIDSLLVDDALELKESGEKFSIFSKKRLATDVLEFFQESTRKGQMPTVILITESGKSNQKPIGLFTITEIPKIISSLSFS